ncbi:MAG: 4-alpha-glucanotransferase [Chloroflexota bacterium]|nr:4-alpha-glucanotransferase [Chloroflexota bacterium]
MSARRGKGALHELAHECGIQTAYYDVHRRRHQAEPEVLLAALRALGVPVQTIRDAGDALRDRRQCIVRRCLEPVTVAWDGVPAEVVLHVPEGWDGDYATCEVELEEGEVRCWVARLAPRTAGDRKGFGSEPAKSASFVLPAGLPWGYHRLRVSVGGGQHESMVICAPLTAHQPREAMDASVWGVFLPLYALHSSTSWGGGDFSDLERLVDWVGSMGGKLVATLPILAAFLDEPFEPSPYGPVSRLMWNELFLDIMRAAEVDRCRSASDLLSSPSVGKEIDGLRALPFVDYRREMVVKRRVLQELASCWFAGRDGSGGGGEEFARRNPLVDDYAQFRATCERRQAPWTEWPDRLRRGVLRDGDYEEQSRQYHLYVQWLAQTQLEGLNKTGRRKGVGLCLDLPLGVHPWGYDVWRYQDVFVPQVCGGAPPDAVFTCGQNWAFPPLHPQRLREQYYSYFIACVRHHLRSASMLRIDHVMGLHRLFWIPKGAEARQGVYVRYPSEELYAILTLESRRHKTTIVGEDLGTVPPYVRPAMKRHGVHRSYVVQYELTSDLERGLRRVPSEAVASLDTHDMPPFAAFWLGLDIPERERLGVLSKSASKRERTVRRAMRDGLIEFLKRKGHGDVTTDDVRNAMKAVLALLAASPAVVLLVNLEDLWLETRPHNVPGTGSRDPNWRRKSHYAFEEMLVSQEVTDLLRELDGIRKERSS